MSAALKLALGSLLVGVVVLGLKALAWRITGSVALLSDALESTVKGHRLTPEASLGGM